MGFYGNIKNTSRTQFTFDKIYPSRYAMDEAISNVPGVESTVGTDDGIYAGRFVLVEYDSEFHQDQFIRGILLDGILYSTSVDASSVLLPFRQAGTNASGAYEVHDYFVAPNTIVFVPAVYNFDTADAEDELYILRGAETSKTEVQQYYFDIKHSTVTPRQDEEGNNITETVTYIPAARWSAVDGNDTNFAKNFALDKNTYQASRGYDSTVWQKVYENSKAKYVMVAELNSVVPTFDVTSDAPSQLPQQPYFDADSTNVYYRLHTQPSWGFRIKAATPNQQTPILNAKGDDTGRFTTASVNAKEYPSDATTQWEKYKFNPINGDVVHQYFDPTSAAWMTDTNDPTAKIPSLGAAIYFNKSGFDPKKIVYSSDKAYVGWTNNLISDEISIAPTGKSGHMYNSHDPLNPFKAMPDTEEISVMLPSIGDTMAEIWDLIYGGKNLSKDGKTRNTDVQWHSAKSVIDKTGARMVHTLGPGLYSYDEAGASTVAGALNSVHDLMGMIIVDGLPADLTDTKDAYIYYDSENKKYVFRQKTWDYTPVTFPDDEIPDDYDEYAPVDNLVEWDKAYFYVEQNEVAGKDFVMDTEFHPQYKYLPFSVVSSAMTGPVTVGEEYRPDGTFYYWDREHVYGNGAPYEQLMPSFETYDPSKDYYRVEISQNQIPANAAIYLPNTYYRVIYEPVFLSNTTYEPGIYYFDAYEIDSGTLEGTYILANGETLEDNGLPGFTKRPTKYYKRRYVLDTGLNKQNVTYYRVRPDAEQTSNAYYRQEKTAQNVGVLSQEHYAADIYYYMAEEGQDVSGYTIERIDGNTYIKDSNVNPTPGRVYYSIKIEYILVEGADVIEITDDNAEMIDVMHDISEYNDRLFYAYMDGYGVTSYIKVTYNNFKQAYNSLTRQYEFVVLDYSLIGSPYAANKFYYKIEEAEDRFNGSYVLDSSDDITEGRNYYTFAAAPSVDYDGTILTQYYGAGEYYVPTDDTGKHYELDSDPEYDDSKTYFKPTQALYVISDTNGVYTPGAKWPIEITKIPNGVVVGTREDTFTLTTLDGFADKLTTIHGLLLELYKQYNPNDKLTRDTSTMRGAINQINDLMNRFNKMVPGEILLVDEYGCVHSAPSSTDELLTVTINDSFSNPSIALAHTNAHTVDNTNSTENLNSPAKSTIEVITPLVDRAGHVVGKNTNTVTLPYAISSITAANSTATSALTANANTIAANQVKDAITISSANKWITLAASGKTLNIAHALVSDNWAGQKSNSQTATPAFGSTFNVPVITTDNAGHITAFTTETVKIPGFTFTADNGANNDVVLDLKLLANRSDLYSVANIAREIGCLLDRPVNIPEPKKLDLIEYFLAIYI